MEHAKKPKVAIFMSCYNHEKYVAEAIESIIHQTYPHWELFVVNDGSTDRSGEIIASFHDERIHFYDLKENTRYAGAIEMIYDIIRPLEFDYVQSMASDDVLEIHKIEKQIVFFEEHPEYAVCFTWDNLIYAEGAEEFPEDYSHVKNRSRYSWLNRFYNYGNCINSNSALIRKDVFYEMDTLNQHYISMADFRLWFMIAAKYPVYLIQEELTSYRRHATNISNIRLGSMMSFYQEYTRILQDVVGRMDRHTFRRAYYSHLTYKDCCSEEELLAEKTMMLLSGATPDKEQAALNIYFTNCSNREYTRALKEKYGFDNDDFSHLKENGGLPYAGNMILSPNEEEDIIPRQPRRIYNPGQQLLRIIGKKELLPETMHQYTYATLLSLNMLYDTNERHAAQFQNVKTLLQKMRVLRRMSSPKRKVLFIVASESPWRLNPDNTPFQSEDKTEFYMAFVNPEEIMRARDLFALTEEDRIQREEPAVSGYIDLWDAENQALCFADQRIEGLTDICYVDCLNLDYECYEMITGYSLDIAQSAIMDQETYEYMLQDDPGILRMMDGIYYY